MSGAVGKRDVLKLYRALLRHGGRFADYNFREYTLRKTRHEFVRLKNETDGEVIKKAYYHGLTNLNIVKNQATISQMFAASPNVLENRRS